MGRVFLTFYYSLCYSVGVASFIYAVILRFTARREPFLGRFITCTAVMTAIVAAAAVAAIAGDTLTPDFLSFLTLIRFSAAAVFTYFITAFTSEVFPFRGARAVKRIALVLTVTGLAFCAADLFLRGERWIEIAVLLIKNIAIVGSVLIVLIVRPDSGHVPDNTPYRSFLRTVSRIVAVLMPFILWEEIGSRLGIFPIHINGTLTLPAFYGVWSAAFIAAHLRQEPIPAVVTGAGADGGFISRYGITPREGELLGLLLQGQSYKMIMTALSISMPTVKSHIASLYRKTGTANRLELAGKVASESGGTAR